jgi:hypothetical protein
MPRHASPAAPCRSRRTLEGIAQSGFSRPLAVAHSLARRCSRVGSRVLVLCSEQQPFARRVAVGRWCCGHLRRWRAWKRQNGQVVQLARPRSAKQSRVVSWPHRCRAIRFTTTAPRSGLSCQPAWATCLLTTSSSGRFPACSACLQPPLMANVRRHGHHHSCTVRPFFS